MKISTSKHFLVDALRNIRRNITISTASSATVAATLFILGVFLMVILNVKQGIKDLESKVEVKVFLNEDISVSQKSDIENRIKSINGVENIEYETKDQALNKVKESFGEKNKSLVVGLEKHNPFPSSYIVKVKTPQVVSDVVSTVTGMPGIYEIRDERKLVDTIMSFTNTLKWAGGIILIILIGVSLFLIENTIKLTVYSRRREIGIMKYIGATDWFIRWPFIIEGMIIGFFGAVLAVVVLYNAYNLAFLKISSVSIFIALLDPKIILKEILWIFLLAGMSIGSIGSIMSIRKFLSV